jgi:hypothetical protein
MGCKRMVVAKVRAIEAISYPRVIFIFYASCPDNLQHPPFLLQHVRARFCNGIWSDVFIFFIRFYTQV